LRLLDSAAKIIDQTGLGQPAAFAVFIAVSNFISTIVALRLIDGDEDSKGGRLTETGLVDNFGGTVKEAQNPESVAYLDHRRAPPD
jgi:hypothetical protein